MNLEQDRPSSSLNKRGFVLSFEPFEIPFTFSFYISQNSEPFEKVLQNLGPRLLGALSQKRVLDLNPIDSTFSFVSDLPLSLGFGGAEGEEYEGLLPLSAWASLGAQTVKNQVGNPGQEAPLEKRMSTQLTGKSCYA